MNDLFEDATEEELAAGDRTCIICREEMQSAKKLACGHMFHARCLQSWLKRQLSCPTCRAPIDVNGPSQNRTQAENQQQNNAAPREQEANQRQPNAGNINNAGAGRLNGNGAANMGEAGARLVNIANQWWNQVMIQANPPQAVPDGQGIAPQANAPVPERANPMPDPQGVPERHPRALNPQRPHRAFITRIPPQGGAVPRQARHQELPVPQNFPMPATIFGARQYPLPQAQAQLQNGGENTPAEHSQGRNPRDIVLSGRAVMHGPNALAHMQLRARRRVALTQPHQQQIHRPEQHERHQTPTPPNVFQPFPGMNQPPQVNRNSRERIAAGNSTGGIVGSDDQARNITSVHASSVNGAQSELSGEDNGPDGTTASIQRRSANPSCSEREFSSAASERTHHVEATVTPLPLDRLISIQEKIEELRNEVMQLVLQATAPPQQIPRTESSRTIEQDASSAQTNDDQAGDLGVQAALSSGGSPAHQENTSHGNSEAEDLRRRRLEYLGRGRGN